MLFSQSIEGHPEKPNPSEKLYTYRDYKIMALTNFFWQFRPTNGSFTFTKLFILEQGIFCYSNISFI